EVRASDMLAGLVAEPRCPVTDDQHRGMSVRLVAAQCPQDDGVAEMDVGARGIEPQLDAQPIGALDATLQTLAIDDFHRARAHRIPGAVIKVLSLLHQFVTRSRRRVYTRLTKVPVLF